MARQLIAGIPDFRTLRGRLLFWILAVAIPIYAGATYLSYQSTSQRLEIDAIQEADDLAARMAVTVDGVVRPIEAGIRTVAYQMEELDPPRSQYLQRIRGILAAWPDIYGSTIAVEANRPGADPSPFAPYLFRGKNGEIGYADLAVNSYGYRDLPWYRVAATSLQPVWSAPYFDAGGGETWMITYSVPFFFRKPGGGHTLAGIVTADLDLEWIRRQAGSSPLGSMGMAWVFPNDKQTAFVAPVGDSTNLIARFDPQFNLEAMRAAGDSMLASHVNFGNMPRNVSREPAYLAVRNLRTTGWHLALVIPRQQLLAEARQLLNRQIMLGGVGLLLLIIAVSMVAAGVTRPIRDLAVAVGGVDADNLDIRLPDTTRRDELGVLTTALRRLRDSLQRHVELRVSSLAAQALMDHELEVSAQIQQSMLPRGPASRTLPMSVEIATALQPARQVGGDLYDFFPLPDGQVLFAIGDVSDKGVPAALFMARLSALMRVLGTAGHGPARLLQDINERLAADNETCMFVTAGCGMLDPATGRYRYASAGHEAPMLRRLEGQVSEISVQNGPAIGIETTAEYAEQEGVIAPGDTLLLFTDGVTEAETADGTLFGTDRLIALLEQMRDGAPQALIAEIVARVSTHAAGFRATDDMTAMALRFSLADVTARTENDGAGWLMEVGNSAAGVELAQQRLCGILQARSVDPARIHDVELIAEEWLTNVVRSNSETCVVSMDVFLNATSIKLTFRDGGIAFNPLDAASPDLDAHIVDRPIGGLGIHLLREIPDSCHYSRLQDCNQLQVQFRRAG